LLYEEGSFFKRHKDSEKAPGMIGTLVVCLPSKHEGGEVCLSHAGKDFIFATAPSSDFSITSLRWYSDFTHEIKKVTSGHRLVLTYNLIQTSGIPASASFLTEQSSNLKTILLKWRAEFLTTQRLVYFLDHKYSPTSLLPKYMKGRDRMVIDTLRAVCNECGFYPLLAQVTKTEEDCDGVMDGDGKIELKSIVTFSGTRLCYSHPAEVEDILGDDPYDGRDPDSVKEEEFTGNASQPAEYRYNDSVCSRHPCFELKVILLTRIS
jgi:hypothetical protein